MYVCKLYSVASDLIGQIESTVEFAVRCCCCSVVDLQGWFWMCVRGGERRLSDSLFSCLLVVICVLFCKL